MKMNEISNGVCAAKGFKAAAVACGIKKSGKPDLAAIVSENRAACACVYTRNLVKGAPIAVTRENVADGYARAVIVNSGNANTCNDNGVEIARGECALMEKHLGVPSADVVVASTGVIGQEMSLEPFKTGIPALAACLGTDGTAAAKAIMTTDTRVKEIAFEFDLGGVSCKIGGMAKGSGMIHPDMATMLVFITTDAAVTPEMLQKALSADIDDSFNMISVDGDTSTNDMVTALANGLAENAPVTAEGEDYDTFRAALSAVTGYLCREIARDGEGATKLLECIVSGAVNTASAKAAAKSVIRSPLVKTAMFGADANWGRVLCAIGYSGADADADKVAVSFRSAAGSVEVCKDGRGVDFSEDTAKTVLSEDEIVIDVRLGDGGGSASAWGCDLTYEYVKINGEYRS